jgi:hypothetical protein
MEETAIRTELHDKIDHADSKQLQQLYGLVLNYLNGKESSDDWDLLPELHKNLILKGLAQANAGLGTELGEANAAIRSKFGIDG